MRTIKELLIILRDNLEKCFADYHDEGMCTALDSLYFKNTISYGEYKELERILNSRIPDFALKRRELYNIHHDAALLFWWEPGEVKPRLEWLNEQIALL